MSKISAVIGRFQVHQFTDAHKEVLDTPGPKIVLLGVNPMDGREHRHPLLFRQRARLIENYYSVRANEFRGVFPIFDQPTDGQWSRDLDKFLSLMFPEDEITLVGGPLTNSFIPHYKGSRTVKAINNALSTSGTVVRKRIIAQVGSPDFLAGQIYGIENQFPRVYPVVDIGVMRDKDTNLPQLLLIKRGDTGEWALPGGFVDPADVGLEEAAWRELHEEVGINLEIGAPMYVGSFQIDDWRYRSSRDKVMSSLFRCQHMWGEPELTKEAVDFGWWIKPMAVAQVCANHKPLVEALFNV